jgi:dipeptidyl aminopeptidase/acylaminoacyl peptidase
MLLRMIASLVALAAPASAQDAPVHQPDPYVLPNASVEFLDMLYSPAQYQGPRLSPSGRQLAYIHRPDIDVAEYHLVVVELDAEGGPRGRAMSFGEMRPQWVRWANEDRLLIGTAFDIQLRGRRGRQLQGLLPQGSRILSMPADLSGEQVVLFANEGRRVNRSNWRLSEIVDYMPDDPDHVLMPAMRGDSLHLWKVNVLTGDAELIERGSRRTEAWHTVDGEAVMRIDITSRGRRLEIFTRTGRNGRWQRTLRLRRKDLEERDTDFEWAGETGTPGEIFVRARPEGAEFIGIHRYDLETGEFLEDVAAREDFDIATALIDSWSGEYYGYSYVADRQLYHFENERFASHYRGLVEFFGDQIEVRPYSFGGDRMIVRASGPTELGTYYMYDSVARSIDPLFAIWPETLGVVTAEMHSVSYRARDGLLVRGFMTWPASGAGPRTPLVVMPHGGPELRDRVAFDDVSQYLASLGYAVFQPNFRGSAGYGQSYVEAGHEQWGLAMQDDITDGVEWLRRQGLVDRDRACILGFSYGGYAALAAATLTPDLFQCVVAGGSVTDLPEFLEHKEEFSDSVYEYWLDLLGDPDDAADQSRMIATSPARLATYVQRPIFLIHGENDRSVPVEQSRLMAEALEEAGAEFVYLEAPGGGHNWGRGEDNFRRTMRNIAAFLDDAMDGSMDTFEPEIPAKDVE